MGPADIHEIFIKALKEQEEKHIAERLDKETATDEEIQGLYPLFTVRVVRAKKCFFTYIHFDLFRSQPSSCTLLTRSLIGNILMQMYLKSV